MINTIPDIAFQEYLSLFRDRIRVHFPDIDERVLYFHDVSSVHLTKDMKSVISVDDIWDESGVQIFIERLCDEKRGWIHMMGDGLLPDGSYLVGIDYSRNMNVLKTNLNMAGTLLTHDGRAVKFTRITVIPSNKPE